MISAIYILDSKGKSLICRDYRGELAIEVIEKFFPLLIAQEDLGVLECPLIIDDNVVFHYAKYQNVYLVTTSLKDRNVNSALIFSALQQIIEVFIEYFKELEEESIRDNFVVLYELLDELIDHGYPQITETNILKEYITQESHQLTSFLESTFLDKKPTVDTKKAPTAVTNAVSWRSEGIKYRKNEVFLDVIESVNLLTNKQGNVLRCDVHGSLKMKVQLSGMPELKLGLNEKLVFHTSTAGSTSVNFNPSLPHDNQQPSSPANNNGNQPNDINNNGTNGSSSSGTNAIELEYVKFHQCVKLSQFDTDRTISFIPPDGDFELMSYRLTNQMRPLIWVESIVEKHPRSRIEYMIKAKSQFKRKSVANDVEIIVPLPPYVDSPKFKTTTGYAYYAPQLNAMVWKVKQFGGGKEIILRAHFGLQVVQGEDEAEDSPLGPIQVKFEIPYFTTSGIQIRYLKTIEKTGYTTLPWVRYITTAGDYQIRMRETNV